MLTGSYVFIFIIYMLGVFTMGAVMARRVKNEGDFWVAGHKLNGFVAGCSLAATQMSAGSVIGSVGVWYGVGWSWTWIWISITIGYIIMVELIGKKLYSLGYYTIPDYLEARFGSNIPRAIAAVVIAVSFTVYIGAQTMAAGYIFRTLFGWPFVWGAIFFTIIYITYTVMGGMFAVAYTDMIQVLVMALGCLIAVPIIFDHLGGMTVINTVIHTIKPSMVSWGMSPGKIFGFWLIFGTWAMCAPQLLIRIVSVKNWKSARQAVWWAAVFNLTLVVGFSIIGIGGRVIFPNLATWDLASPMIASGVLPPLIGGFLLSALIAAMMSTTDSLLLVAGSAIAHDIYAKMINPEASEKQKLKIGRIVSGLIGIIPFMLIFTPYFKGTLIQFIVASSVALVSCTFWAPLVIGLRWIRGTKEGCIWAMILGFLADLGWLLAGKPWGLNEVYAGMVMSIAAFIVVSYMTPKTSVEQLGLVFSTQELEGNQAA